MPTLRHSVLALCAAPLAFALAACDSSSEDGAPPPTGEPIAEIPAPAGQSWLEMAAVTPEGGYVIGNPAAPLKLVEYASHTCHVCAAFSQEGAAEMDEYVGTGVVSYEIRNLIRDPVDLTIALLARCGQPSSFHPLANQAWQNFDSLMGTVQANGAAIDQARELPEAQRFQAIGQASGLLDFFAARGISRDQAMQCLGDLPKATQIVDASRAQSDELAIEGTPTFFLNGRRIQETSWAGLEPVLQAAGAR
ncbi:MAG TPA: thioredoxin domain-containing protein [Croceibacterium sp.]|nr:thioredoxin domain-containing protein [Solirubrobacterales bacterium]HYD24445.1 thioredoxin domain-containing protein [Croceibacterium sp.]